MDSDPWKQWRLYGARFAPAGVFAAGWPEQAGSMPSGSAADAFERFSAAAQAHFQSLIGASAQASDDRFRAFSDVLRALFVDLPAWTGPLMGPQPMQPNLGGEAPALGPNRESELRCQRMAGAWRRAVEAQRLLQNFWIDALREASTGFVATLDGAGPPATNPEAAYELYRDWIDRLEDAYAKMAHSEGFCNALAATVNAVSDWRHEMRAEIEESAKAFDLPTRSEVSALVRRVKHLENELRNSRSQGAKKSSQPKRARARARKKS